MKKNLYRAMTVIMAAVVMLSFTPVSGSQNVYAKSKNYDVGDISYDLYSYEPCLSENQEEALSNVLEELEYSGMISATYYDDGEDDVDNDHIVGYDIDLDGNVDVMQGIVSDDSGDHDIYYAADTTSLEAISWSVGVIESVKSDLKASEEYYCDNIEFNFPIIIDEIEVEITKPEDGTVTMTEKTGEEENQVYDLNTQTNRPQIKIKDSSEWIDADSLVKAWTATKKWNSDPFIGTFRKDEKYFVRINNIRAQKGYVFAEDINVTVNDNVPRSLKASYTNIDLIYGIKAVKTES